MLEIGMMDLGLLIGEGSWRARWRCCWPLPQDLRVHQALPAAGQIVAKADPPLERTAGEEMRHKPVPVALEQEYRLYQAHRGCRWPS